MWSRKSISYWCRVDAFSRGRSWIHSRPKSPRLWSTRRGVEAMYAAFSLKNCSKPLGFMAARRAARPDGAATRASRSGDAQVRSQQRGPAGSTCRSDGCRRGSAGPARPGAGTRPARTSGSEVDGLDRRERPGRRAFDVPQPGRQRPRGTGPAGALAQPVLHQAHRHVDPLARGVAQHDDALGGTESAARVRVTPRRHCCARCLPCSLRPLDLSRTWWKEYDAVRPGRARARGPVEGGGPRQVSHSG